MATPKKTPKYPNEPATGPQTWAIFIATGYDVRESKLTRGEASSLIDLSKEGQDIVPLVKELPKARLVDRKKGGTKASTPKASAPKQDTRPARRYDGTVHFRFVDSGTGLLSLPKPLAQHLRAGMVFKPELTPEGILYRPVHDAPPPDEDLPDWVP